MERVLNYFPRNFTMPAGVFEELRRDPRRTQIAWTSMIAMSLAYMLVSVFLTILHSVPPVPFLRIPTADYYFWASFFYVPVLIAGWIFGAAVLQLVGRALGGYGNFEDTFALAGFATATATLASLVPDLTITTLQVLGFMDYDAWHASVSEGGTWFVITWLYLGLYLVLFAIFYTAVARSVHALSNGRAIVVGMTGFVAYQAFIFVFIR